MNKRVLNSISSLLNLHYICIVEIDVEHNTYKVKWSSNELNYIIESNITRPSGSINLTTIYEHIHPDDIKTVEPYMNFDNIIRIIDVNNYIKFRYRQDVGNGYYRWVEIEMIHSKDGSNIIDVFVKDIDRDYAVDYIRHRKLEELSSIDSLTGFRNRYSYDKLLNSMPSSTLGVVYLDLNNLKQVNDSDGHQAGDYYIKRFCSIVSSIFRLSDCYRVGGDEFVIVIKNISKSSFYSKLAKLIESTFDTNLGHPLAAIGYEWSDSGSDDIQSLVHNAEKLMYEDKAVIQKRYHIKR